MDGSFPTAEMFFPLRKSPWHLLWAIWEVRKGNDMDSYKTSEWKWNSNHVIKTVFQWTEIGVSVCMFSLWAQSLYKKGGRGCSTVKEGWWLLCFWAALRKEQGWTETRKNAEWECVQNTLLHMQVMEEACLWEHASLMRGRAAQESICTSLARRECANTLYNS